MPRFNPLQEHIRNLPPLHVGAGRSIGMPIEGTRISRLEAAQGAGLP